MTQYVTGIKNYTRGLTILFTASLFALSSCSDKKDELHPKYNFELTTRAGETAATLIPNIRLFNFNKDDNKYRSEVLNLTRTSSTITAQVETGIWNMALVAAPSGTLIAPNMTKVVSQLPMYKYAPTLVGSKSTDAAEIYLDNRETPQITAETPKTMNAELNRTVAKVELIFEQTTSNFNLSGAHTIRLCHVPTTISYTGTLLPSAANPDTVAGGLTSNVTLVQNGSFLKGGNTVEFIIPAHRGDTYTTNGTPTDVTSLKMGLHVRLQRTGGGYFDKYVELDKVAICNHILRVNIKVNDGIEFNTSIEKWERVDINSLVGMGYQNWLYVKKGAVGNGLAWNDALPDINTAITKAAALKAIGKTVNGILVAGGETLVYDGGFNIPADIRIYGGWKGDTGTELSAMDVNAPYTSADRDLKTYKARVATGTGNIQLVNTGAVLDGFVVSGQGSSGAQGLVAVFGATAWINAVEIDRQNSLNTDYALSVAGGTATNVLVSRNNKPGIYVGATGKVVNATIVENADRSQCYGMLLNSVYWGNGGYLAELSGSTIKYCAVDMLGGTGTMIYPLSATNNLWFTVSNLTPGPHFDLGATSGLARYEVGTAKPNRSPMLRRGNKSLFDNNLPIALADQYKTDINGNVRYHMGIDGATQVVDIGCYEDGSHVGFQLQWATDKVYVSAKKGYFSQLPLLLPANEDPDINIAIDWTVNVQGGSLTGCSFDGSVINDIATGANTGSGSGVMVGMVQFTPTVEYETNAERQLGSISISTQLGVYLPNVTIPIWQTSGLQFKWTQGYVGSFHRNNERGARFIYGTNQFGGNWTARIFSGLDWIKIDTNEKDYGDNITDADEGKTPTNGYYKEVKETWGGVVSGTGDVKFRVGMKSKNTTGKPRYGLIILTRTGGVSYFFVRQGEEPDYLYRTQDVKPAYGARTAAYVKKFSPFSLTDPQGRLSTTGTDLGPRGGRFTKYPTQIGYYFKSNSTVGYVRGTVNSTSATGYSSWSTEREVCPIGYRHASQLEYINSLYYDVADTPTGTVNPGEASALRNYEWGAYADGWYDQLLPNKSTSYANVFVSSGVNYACKGILIVSHNNYASIFFPGAGRISGSTVSASDYVMNHTNNYRNTHWNQSKDYVVPPANRPQDSGGHIGMNCTTLTTTYAATVRCIKE